MSLSSSLNGIAKFCHLNYSSYFWKDLLNEVLTEKTNLYSMQKTNEIVRADKDEIKQFICIQIYILIIELPFCSMYWSEKTNNALYQIL